MATVRTQAAEVSFRDHLLDALTVASGAMDAISFMAFGRVFTAFMTGNIVFLGLRASGASSAPGAEALVAALAGFGVGVYLGTRIVVPTKDASIWPRGVTRALGLSLIFHALSLMIWFAVDGHPLVHTVPVLLALWGLAMGMQSAAVRALRVEGVFTTAATATIIFLAADIASWPTTAVERRRLVTVLLALFVGATAGGFLLLHAHIYAPVLPFVTIAAVVATAARVWRGVPSAPPAGAASNSVR
jgi:uncharacterized membrane protein YoaK (UPF0700 family)